LNDEQLVVALSVAALRLVASRGRFLKLTPEAEYCRCWRWGLLEVGLLEVGPTEGDARSLTRVANQFPATIDTFEIGLICVV